MANRDILEEGLKLQHSLGGSNLHNQLIANITRRTAGQREIGIGRARDVLGRDEPGVLAELFGNIEQGARREFGEMTTRADVLQGQAMQTRATNLLNIGMALRQIEERKSTADKQFKRDLWTGLLGGGLGLAGAAIGAGGQASALTKLIEAMRAKTTEETPGVGFGGMGSTEMLESLLNSGQTGSLEEKLLQLLGGRQ